MIPMLTLSCLALAAAFVTLYNIGAPCNSYTSARSILPWLAFLVSIVPIVMLPTRWVDTANKGVLATAYFLSIALPFTLWQLGHPLLLSISSLGSGLY